MNLKTSTSLCVLAGSLLATSNSFAGAKMQLSDDSAIEFGGSIRAELISQEDGAAEGDSISTNLHSMRFYLKGKVTDSIAFQLQTEHKGGTMVMLDTLAKFKVSDNVNVWAGRFIPPSDRSNLSGSYNLPTWQYPGVVSKYPIPKKGGRDDGIAIMGSKAEGRLAYSFGMFNGKQDSAVPTDSEAFSGRLAYSFWDKEGYLTRSTYFGKKDILTVGLTAMQQEDAFGDGTATSDFLAYNLDFMMEKNLASGALATVEAAVYDYDQYGGNTAKEGDAYMISVSYMPPGEYGPGRIQPSLRYQSFSPADSTVEDTTRWDVGITSVIRGHGARIGLFYGSQDTAGSGDVSVVKIGLQLKL
ncbi:OprO/OprP family phosphate-selective porin [Porticoccaceae bacterium]|nr:OprO/OprP family phosphate-selective porin [Porticoccaceae bacterium]